LGCSDTSSPRQKRLSPHAMRRQALSLKSCRLVINGTSQIPQRPNLSKSSLSHCNHVFGKTSVPSLAFPTSQQAAEQPRNSQPTCMQHAFIIGKTPAPLGQGVPGSTTSITQNTEECPSHIAPLPVWAQPLQQPCMLFSPRESCQSCLKRTKASQAASGSPCALVRERVQGSSGFIPHRTMRDAHTSKTENQIQQLGKQIATGQWLRSMLRWI